MVLYRWYYTIEDTPFMLKLKADGLVECITNPVPNLAKYAWRITDIGKIAVRLNEMRQKGLL